MLRNFTISYDIFLEYPGCCSLKYPWDCLYQSGAIWDLSSG